MSKAEETKHLMLEAAARAFADQALEQVSISDVSRSIGKTSQSFYHYFKDKSALYREAFMFEMERLQNSVIEAKSQSGFPFLSGEIWRNYSETVPEFPFARRVLLQRDAPMLNLINDLPSTAKIFELAIAEVELGQRAGVTRSDIDVRRIMTAHKFLYGLLRAPLLAEGKFNSPEWMESSILLVSSLFYPCPDLSNPKQLADFAKDMLGRLEVQAQKEQQSGLTPPG